MEIEEFLYSLGEKVEGIINVLKAIFSNILKSEPSENPPSLKITSKLTKRKVTIHELMSLHLQLVFLAYLAANFVEVVLPRSTLSVPVTALVYFIYIRSFLRRYGEFMIDDEPYRSFYYGISAIAFVAFMGYSILRMEGPGVYYYYGYVGAVALAVVLFRWYFRERHGRDYAYGVVEDVKGELVRVFVHDDIAANVKPGLYWVPKVEGAEKGRVVRVLVEDRPMRSAVPVRIIEVLDHQSSDTDTEPNEATE